MVIRRANYASAVIYAYCILRSYFQDLVSIFSLVRKTKRHICKLSVDGLLILEVFKGMVSTLEDIQK